MAREEDRKAHYEMQIGIFVIYRTSADVQKLGLSRGSEHGCSPPPMTLSRRKTRSLHVVISDEELVEEL